MMFLGALVLLAFAVALLAAGAMTLSLMATLTTASTMDVVAVGVWWLVCAVLLVGLVCVQGFYAVLRRPTPAAPPPPAA